MRRGYNRSPATAKEFRARTRLLIIPAAVRAIEAVAAARGLVVSDKDRAWFLEHVDVRVRWLYTNRPSIGKALRLPWGDGTLTDLAYRWARIFLRDMDHYRLTHPHQLWELIHVDNKPEKAGRQHKPRSGSSGK